jgi:hypothetical protein
MERKDVYEELESVLQLIEMAVANYRNGDHMSLLRCLGGANDHLAVAAVVTVQKAYNAGATKKALAQALDCPPSTFRELVRT